MGFDVSRKVGYSTNRGGWVVAFVKIFNCLSFAVPVELVYKLERSNDERGR